MKKPEIADILRKRKLYSNKIQLEAIDAFGCGEKIKQAMIV